jgi:hypothetical protein
MVNGSMLSVPGSVSNSSAGSNETASNVTSGNSSSNSSSNSSVPVNGTDSNSSVPVNGTEVNTTSNVTVTNDTVSNITSTGGRRLQEVNSTAVNGTDVNGTAVNGTGVNGTDVNGTSAVPPMNASNSSEVNSSVPVNGSGNGTGVVNGTNSSSNGTVSVAGQIKCCDYYEQGAGYEFSICDGIGAIIRPDLIGGARDMFYAAQSPVDLLAPVWTDLNNLIINYCDARLAANSSSNSSSNMSGNATAVDNSQLMNSLDLPWAQWGQDLLQGVEGLGVWLARYVSYLGAAQNYLSANFPASEVLQTVEQGLASIDPNLNLTNVTYGELVTDYHNLYGQFVQWYGSFFGANGVIQLSERIVYDGVVPVYEFSANASEL